jgi:hypothetical protein
VVLAVTLSACSSHGRSTASRTTSTSGEVPFSPYSTGTEQLTATHAATPHYSYAIDYVQLKGGRNPDIRTRINEILRRDAQAMADEFVTNVRDNQASSATPDTGESSITVKSEATAVGGKVFSVRSVPVSYFAGAAHPVSSVRTWNFDTDTGRQLQLADLFRAGVPYLQKLSDEARQQLKATDGYNEEIATLGTTPTEEHFKAFSLTDTTLEINFEQYQVAAGAAGQPKIEITYTSLHDLLARPGPLGDH